jgi:hypothetical protein
MRKNRLAGAHADLLDEQERLMAEHARLHKDPYDVAGHEAHRQALKRHIERLHAHVARLRTIRQGDV